MASMKNLEPNNVGLQLKLSCMIALCGLILLASPQLAQPVLGKSSQVSVYFSNPFDSSSSEFEQHLTEFINHAEQQLDVAVYEIRFQKVLNALIEACERGVMVRVVTEVEIENGNSTCLQAKHRPESRYGAMHHKFVVADKRLIWTGATNWTETGLQQNANNALVITSHEIASIYAQAFEWLFDQEQFGKKLPGIMPGPFQLDHLSAQIFFSPNDQIENEIIRAIQSAKSSIHLAMFYYTNETIHRAILDAMSRGIKVDAILSQRGIHDCMTSLMDDLIALGVGVIAPLEGVLHHKFAVIDDTLVITGSANWTNNGMRHNDENILILESRHLAQQYQQEFDRLKADALNYSTHPKHIRWVNRHFNQMPGTIRLEWHPVAPQNLIRYEVCRSETANNICAQAYMMLPPAASFFVDNEVKTNQTYLYQLRAIYSGGRAIESNPLVASASSGANYFSAEDVQAQAKSLYGKQVGVELAIHHVNKTSSGHFLFHTNENIDSDLTAFVPACAVERFSALGIDLNSLNGKSIHVTGVLKSYHGPEIILYDPGQLITKDSK
jgi:phosphatidylserine/phosphatidylglycerophosphate/cardiolipin synthase-like enzyme